jgi:hypothetical protein
MFYKLIANCRKGTSPKNSQYEFSPSCYSSVTLEYQDGKTHIANFSDLFLFLQLAIQIV